MVVDVERGGDAERRGPAAAWLRGSRIGGVCEIVVVFGAAAGTLLMLRPLVGEGPIEGAIPASGAILVQLGLVWVGLRLRGERCARLGLRFVRFGWRDAAGVLWRAGVALVLAVAGFVVGAVVGANAVGVPEADLSAYNPMAGNLGLLMMTLPVVWVTASFGEEVIYRGFVITRVEQIAAGGRRGRWGVVAGVVAGAVLFGVAHFAWGAMGMVQTGFMGLGLGVSYVMFGRNLWVVVLAHGAMDTTLLVQMYAQ